MTDLRCSNAENWPVMPEFNLPVILGYDDNLQLRVVDLANLPHLLVAGTTRQGQEVFLRNLVRSLVCRKKPEELKFALIGAKVNDCPVSFPDAGYEFKDSPHCTAADSSSAEAILSALCREMEKRLELTRNAGSREKSCHLPYIVCICDEYADLILGTDNVHKKSIRDSILRLARAGRTVGIHLVMNTQKPCTETISCSIKANFPARIAFRVPSQFDSMMIVDHPGAEKLTENCEMLFSTGPDCNKFQVPSFDLIG